MKKMIITLDADGEVREAQLRIPLSVCDRIDLKQLEDGVAEIFSAIPGVDVISIEATEETRHNMGRRKDDHLLPQV